MASFQGLAAVEPSHNYGPNVESVMQNGKTITVKVSDSMGELIGANVLVKGTTIGNVTDMNGSVTVSYTHLIRNKPFRKLDWRWSNRR